MIIPEIKAVKDELEAMKKAGHISGWELPYENLLTRLDAAIFFVGLPPDGDAQSALEPLGRLPHFRVRENSEQKLSRLSHRVEFSEIVAEVAR